LKADRKDKKQDGDDSVLGDAGSDAVLCSRGLRVLC